MSIPNWQLPGPINEICAAENAIPQWEPFGSMRGPLLTRQTLKGKFVRWYILQSDPIEVANNQSIILIV